jgi:DNA-binding CsgD family transcriptional regulator
MLTEISARVLEGVAGGASAAELAANLYLSKQGIDYHMAAMLRKFGVANRCELVARAYVLGVLVRGAWPPRVADASVCVRRHRRAMA